MIWQDYVMSGVMVLLSYALIPQILRGFKHKKCDISLHTSTISFLGLYVLAFSYFTLELYFSTAVTSITATFWLILFIQGKIYSKK